MHVPTSILSGPAERPIGPQDVLRAVALCDEGLYEAIATVHGGNALHDAGVWRLALHSGWTAATAAPARALRDLLGPVRHPLAPAAIEALDTGIALAELAADLDADNDSQEMFATSAA